jgi:hypothetical protein
MDASFHFLTIRQPNIRIYVTNEVEIQSLYLNYISRRRVGSACTFLRILIPGIGWRLMVSHYGWFTRIRRQPITLRPVCRQQERPSHYDGFVSSKRDYHTVAGLSAAREAITMRRFVSSKRGHHTVADLSAARETIALWRTCQQQERLSHCSGFVSSKRGHHDTAVCQQQERSSHCGGLPAAREIIVLWRVCQQQERSSQCGGFVRSKRDHHNAAVCQQQEKPSHCGGLPAARETLAL